MIMIHCIEFLCFYLIYFLTIIILRLYITLLQYAIAILYIMLHLYKNIFNICLYTFKFTLKNCARTHMHTPTQCTYYVEIVSNCFP